MSCIKNCYTAIVDKKMASEWLSSKTWVWRHRYSLGHSEDNWGVPSNRTSSEDVWKKSVSCNFLSPKHFILSLRQSFTAIRNPQGHFVIKSLEAIIPSKESLISFSFLCLGYTFKKIAYHKKPYNPIFLLLSPLLSTHWLNYCFKWMIKPFWEGTDIQLYLARTENFDSPVHRHYHNADKTAVVVLLHSW